MNYSGSELSVSIVEGKKNLSRILRAAESANHDVILTRRGKPVAVLVPFAAYQCSRKADGFQRIMEARASYGQAAVDADSVIEEARIGLRRRP
jgi:prevent-host-death family protein